MKYQCFHCDYIDDRKVFEDEGKDAYQRGREKVIYPLRCPECGNTAEQNDRKHIACIGLQRTIKRFIGKTLSGLIEIDGE